jgi:hypothetical protein
MDASGIRNCKGKSLKEGADKGSEAVARGCGHEMVAAKLFDLLDPGGADNASNDENPSDKTGPPDLRKTFLKRFLDHSHIQNHRLATLPGEFLKLFEGFRGCAGSRLHCGRQYVQHVSYNEWFFDCKNLSFGFHWLMHLKKVTGISENMTKVTSAQSPGSASTRVPRAG